MRGMASPGRPERMPDLRLAKSSATPLQTQLVTFDQTHQSIPVFGSKAVVELSSDRQLISADARLGFVQNVESMPSLRPKEALAAIKALTGAEFQEATVDPPVLNFFQDPKESDEGRSWHLVWLFRNVPAALTRAAVHRGHGLAPSIRSTHPRFNYLVDAHDGAIVYHFSASPIFAVPSKLVGFDEDNIRREFYGSQTATGFEFRDPLHDLVSFDLALGDLDSVQVPSAAISTATANVVTDHRAAISALVNGKRVQDFYKMVLGRDGIDDAGMELISVVNCTYSPGQDPPQWKNAVWWDNKMWYGQISAGGRLVSLARFLDVLAHELTHGVTQYSSNLVYRDQSGALNESFSDIFGVIIKNWWEAPNRDDLKGWSWELGTGLGNNGPLRDLSDPRRTDDPDHMANYDPDPSDEDYGGVHTNSNIHNKAAYGVLTAADASGQHQFSVQDASVLFYMTLVRLAPMAEFADAVQVMIDVASTMYAGDAATRHQKIDAIRGAYGAVGIR
jgi:Zn-dependent metalloprotease